MKKLLASILLLLCLHFGAQAQISVKYVYQYPNASVPPTNYLVLLDPGNGHYQNSTLGQIALQISQILNLTNGTFIVTNIYATNITANTIYVTNLYATTLNVTTNISEFSYITNLYSTNITAYTEAVTLLTATTITNNTFITTNVTIETPGGLTNLNATPKTVAWWDVNDDASSIPNASGVLTNDGAGGIGFSDSISLTEMDVLNFYPTNMFTGLTNYSVLGTDGDGKLTLGSATNSFTATTIYAETNFVDYNYTTNLFYVSGKGNTLIVTNVSVEGTLTNKGIAASSAVITDSHQVETNAVNTHGVFTNTASGPPSFGLLQSTELANTTGSGLVVVLSGSPTETNTTIKGDQYGTNAFFITTWGAVISNNINQVIISNGTIYATGPIRVTGETNSGTTANTLDIRDANKNETSLANGGSYTFLQGTTPPTYTALSYSTNIVGAANFVFGKAYWTNASSNFTFPALTMNDNAAMETLAVWVTNSGAATITATINGVAGAPGHVVPAVFYCTNATVTEIDVSHFGVQWTNACVGKN